MCGASAGALGTPPDSIGYEETSMTVIVGTAGIDILDGTAAADTISGLAGNDIINGFVGADTVNGGTGNDTLVLAATSTDLNTALNNQVAFVEPVPAAAAAADVILNLGLQAEGFVITGGAYNDTITGGAGADNITAGAGDDTINGFTGTDTVNGGADNDTLTLTATSSTLNIATDAQLVGVEDIDASGAGSGVALNLANQSETFTITGSDFADTITGTAGADTIDAGGGDDTINTFNTGDIIEGGGGNDTLFLKTLASVAALNAADDDAISGIEAVTVGSVGRGVTIDLHNQDEGFRITATSYADEIIGADGNDTIVGFIGMDTVDGGNGDDDTIALTTTSIAMNVAADSDIENVEVVSAAGRLPLSSSI
jgi:Hemolysin-type calcium-binding repeat (2 copies).